MRHILMENFVILNKDRFIVFFLLMVINSPALSCQSSFEALGDSCYLFESSRLKTFGDAMAVCQSLQAHLVYIETSGEWSVIQSNLPKEHMWIGLSGLTEQEASWGDGYASIAYENFSPKAFDEMSGCFYIKDGPGDKWLSVPCLDLHGYICEEWTVDTTTASETTTNWGRHTSDMTSTPHAKMTTFSTSMHTTDITSTQQEEMTYSTHYTTDITSTVTPKGESTTSSTRHTTDITSISPGETTTRSRTTKEAISSSCKLSQSSGGLQDAGCQGKYYIGNQFILIKTNFAIQNATTIDITSPKRLMLRCAAVCIRTARCEGFVGNQLKMYCSLITNEQLEQGLTFISEDGALYYKLENI